MTYSMKKLRQSLIEATKTKDKTDLGDMSFDDPSSKGDLEFKTQNPSPSKMRRPGRKGRAVDAAANIPAGGANVMSQAMSNAPMDTVDVDPSDYNEPKDPETLPALPPGQALDSLSDELNITWFGLKDLPGYAVSQIRGMFRDFFKEHLKANLEDIEVATTLTGSSLKDLTKFGGYLIKHGVVENVMNDLTLMGIDPDMYSVEKAVTVDMGDSKYFIMKENLQGTPNYYIYSAKTGSKVKKRFGWFR